MADILGIHHVCVETMDIEESLRYYEEKIGFSLVGREHCSFGEYAMLRYGTARIELIQRGEKRSNSRRPEGPLAHVGFEVDDVEVWFDCLRRRGVEFKTEEVERSDEPLGGIIACSTTGPSGEIISFYHFLQSV